MLTVITINYNNLAGLERTFESVVFQDNLDFEYIVIDGASVDGSVPFLSNMKNSSHLNFCVSSEPDSGIYNAMNKGLKMASREYVLFLNSGDVFCDKSTLTKIENTIKSHNRPLAVYGNVYFADLKGAIVRKWISGNFTKFKVFFGWMPPHPGTAIRLDSILEIGSFDEDFLIAADYDLMLRLFHQEVPAPLYLNDYLVRMENGGVSNSSFKNVVKSNLEVMRSWSKITKFLPFWIFVTKPLSKLFQFLPRI